MKTFGLDQNSFLVLQLTACHLLLRLYTASPLVLIVHFILHLTLTLLMKYAVDRRGAKSVFRQSVTRRLSRIAGYLAAAPIPSFLRPHCFRLYASTYGVNLAEMKNPDLYAYPSISAFFTRELAPSARPVAAPEDPRSLVSPADGTVLSFGEVQDNSMVRCVKGNSYPLDEFLLGYKCDKEAFTRLLAERRADRRSKLLYAVVYLSPGDYHRFHSPAQFGAGFRRRIAGYLEPVKPAYLAGHKDVLKDNERVSLLGEWAHGFFGMSMVGALNVGAIEVFKDKALKTNARNPTYFQDRFFGEKGASVAKPPFQDEAYYRRILESDAQGGLRYEKGEELGLFNFGSTIVLTFECPEAFKLQLSVGQKVRVGQQIGS